MRADEDRKDAVEETAEPQEERADAVETKDEGEPVDETPAVPVQESAPVEKEAAVNAEGIEAEKDKETDDTSESQQPSFFVDESRVEVQVDVLSSPSSGRIMSVSRAGLGLDFSQFGHLSHSVETFEFSTPTYEQLAMYRQRSAVYRREVGQMIIDKIALRNYFLVWHLKDWSLRDRHGDKVELEHDKDGSLTDASAKKVYALQPILLDVVLTVFERDIMLT